MSENTDRTFKQYIEVSVTFDETQDPTAVWQGLWDAGISTKSHGNSVYSTNHFSQATTREVVQITCGVKSILTDHDQILTQTKDLLNALIGEDYWAEHLVTIPVEPTTYSRFNPSQFGFSEELMATFPNAHYWYSFKKDGHCDDIRWSPVSDEPYTYKSTNWVNIHGFNLTVNRDDEDNLITNLTFKLMLRTYSSTYLTESEEDTQVIIDALTKAVRSVAPCTLALGCQGQIEVEKVVSCQRFADGE
tara:strand:+ start:2338 stop:3078 length:741 start_codon:yes stop_codon:yes gene_type:complete